MNRRWMKHYSFCLEWEMNILIHGDGGVPLIVFPCQDGMCDNWESFQMQDTLADYIEAGQIQLFAVDAIDPESWSDTNGDKAHRADMQEAYYHYVVDEALPLIRNINGSGKLPVATGCSMGANHALITFLRRPELFGGVLAMSGCYDTAYFWGEWCNGVLYDNSPLLFLRNMPNDHPYINLYNSRKIAVCVGQGAWEDEGVRTAGILKDLFEQRGIRAWVDFWGHDVNHDWPWWKKQIRYFLPWILEEYK